MDSKIFSHNWKKILLIAIVAAILILSGSNFDNGNIAVNVLLFPLMVSGSFIAILAIWTGITSIWELIHSLILLGKHEKQLRDKNNFHDSSK